MNSRPFRFGLVTFLLFSFFLSVKAQRTDEKFEEILQKSEKLRPVLSEKDRYEIQLIYTKIDRDSRNRPKFTTYYYNYDPNRYFYPASTVKLPAVLLALEKINQLKIDGLTKETPMHIEKAFEGHEGVKSDSSAQNSQASVANYAKKILLVSDNDAFNRLYEFIGQKDFNEKLKNKGYDNLRIMHRLSIFYSPEENATTPKINFGESPNYVYSQPRIKNTSRNYLPTTKILKGTGYQKGDKIINEPFDFTAKNFYGLNEQHNILKSLMFPDAVAVKQRFNLTNDDYNFVYKYMSMLPTETTFPNYNTSEYWDSYVKFFMFGDDKKAMPANIRIFNKVGDAYGFLLDNAYIVDFENKVEFMLSAVINVNENQIYNDGIYAYDKTGFPFMAELGKTIYNYELSRKRKNVPKLDRFKLEY